MEDIDISSDFCASGIKSTQTRSILLAKIAMCVSVLLFDLALPMLSR